MDTAQAWRAVFSLSYGNKWIKIPNELILKLGLPSGVGISGQIICTKRSAVGANRFINRMNTIESRIGK